MTGWCGRRVAIGRIAECSRASATSGKSELKLVNVVRASLDELLLDYEDFLRQRKLSAWGKNDPEAVAVRAVGRKNQPDQGSSLYCAEFHIEPHKTLDTHARYNI
jgi:hypothetical protein